MARERITPMVHRACLSCGMTATMVVTPAGDMAWADHLESHSPPALERIWTWSVQHLPID